MEGKVNQYEARKMKLNDDIDFVKDKLMAVKRKEKLNRRGKFKFWGCLGVVDF